MTAQMIELLNNLLRLSKVDPASYRTWSYYVGDAMRRKEQAEADLENALLEISRILPKKGDMP